MNDVDLVIFDCDGVLVDSEVLSNQVIADSLKGYGLSLTMADCMALFVGSTMKDVRAKSLELGAKLPDNWIGEVYGATYTRLQNEVEIVPGIMSVLDRLDDVGLPFCVASNGSPKKMQITLGRTGLLARFQGVIFSAHELGCAKPDPDLFLIAARSFDVSPARCVVVEDSISGVTAASRAKMRCFAFDAHGSGVNFAALGAEVFADMDELPGLIGL